MMIFQNEASKWVTLKLGYNLSSMLNINWFLPPFQLVGEREVGTSAPCQHHFEHVRSKA